MQITGRGHANEARYPACPAARRRRPLGAMAAAALRGPRWAPLALAAPGAPPPLPGLLPGLLRRLPGPPGRAMAGHNRWSKVRNVKGPRDAERSRLFQRLAQMLRAAAREGGPDPALNAALAAAVQQCRARNMPKASIEAALRRAQEGAGGSRLLLGARGPGGSELLLDVVTGEPRRVPAPARPAAGPVRRGGDSAGPLLGQCGGSLAEGVRHSFEAVGVVRVAGQDGRGRAVSMEVALELALAAGARDVVAEDEAELKFLCDPSSLPSVRQHLEAAGLRPLSAAIEFVPRALLALPEGPRAQAERLLQALGDCPDVVRLYHNIQEAPEGAEGQSSPATGHSPDGQ
ncbi:translational activator of cytochrome c oxidase 1 [Corvus hawaiiensis]|uniref:translational activator of cytochrome c oxidase 1 n=1 Tax=Corvus hawaiiensis TaxID=134902 RepID=UPI00201A0525|nr:translational activator of cytochrome c oxidase 1 [Corvus hawaiiensis]